MGEFEKTDFAHAKGLKNVFVNYHYTMCVYFTKIFVNPWAWAKSVFFFKFSLLLEVESCEMFHLSTWIVYVVIMTFDENETDVLSLKIEFDMCTRARRQLYLFGNCLKFQWIFRNLYHLYHISFLAAEYWNFQLTNFLRTC